MEYVICDARAQIRSQGQLGQVYWYVSVVHFSEFVMISVVFVLVRCVVVRAFTGFGVCVSIIDFHIYIYIYI